MKGAWSAGAEGAIGRDSESGRIQIKAGCICCAGLRIRNAIGPAGMVTTGKALIGGSDGKGSAGL